LSRETLVYVWEKTQPVREVNLQSGKKEKGRDVRKNAGKNAILGPSKGVHTTWMGGKEGKVEVLRVGEECGGKKKLCPKRCDGSSSVRHYSRITISKLTRTPTQERGRKKGEWIVKWGGKRKKGESKKRTS